MPRELRILVVGLGGVCAVAAMALGLLYEVTKAPIAEQQRLRTLRLLAAVLPPYDNEVDKETRDVVYNEDGREFFVQFHEATRGGRRVGVAFKVVAPDGYTAPIEILMGVDMEGLIVGIEILKHKETPGLGDGLMRKEWRETFAGKNLENRIAVKKDGGEIDQFAGATITPRAVTKAVTEGLQVFQQFYSTEGRVDDGGT